MHDDVDGYELTSCFPGSKLDASDAAYLQPGRRSPLLYVVLLQKHILGRRRVCHCDHFKSATGGTLQSDLCAEADLGRHRDLKKGGSTRASGGRAVKSLFGGLHMND